MNAITFQAVVYKVQTITTDNTVRVTLDLSEDCIPEMAMLAETRRQGIPLIFTATVEDKEPYKPSKKRDRSRPD